MICTWDVSSCFPVWRMSWCNPPRHTCKVSPWCGRGGECPACTWRWMVCLFCHNSVNIPINWNNLKLMIKLTSHMQGNTGHPFLNSSWLVFMCLINWSLSENSAPQLLHLQMILPASLTSSLGSSCNEKLQRLGTKNCCILLQIYVNRHKPELDLTLSQSRIEFWNLNWVGGAQQNRVTPSSSPLYVI